MRLVNEWPMLWATPLSTLKRGIFKISGQDFRLSSSKFISKQDETLRGVLLDGVAGAEVARVERLAAGESFVLAMVKTDAVFAELPAEIDVLLIDDGGKIKEADVEVLDEAAGFENVVERGLERFGKLIVLHADRGQFFVGDEHAAHHHDTRGNRGEFVFETREFLAGIHGFDEKRFEFLARALRFGQCEEALWWFRGIVLLLIVVFICHGDSVPGTALSRQKRTG